MKIQPRDPFGAHDFMKPDKKPVARIKASQKVPMVRKTFSIKASSAKKVKIYAAINEITENEVIQNMLDKFLPQKLEFTEC